MSSIRGIVVSGHLVLNAFALAIYFAIVWALGWPGSLDTTVLATMDARSYLAAGNMLRGIPGDFTAYDPLQYRPFLFPLLLSLLTGGGMLAFWAFQMAAWIFAVNATWILLKRMEMPPLLAMGGALLLASHPGLISLSLHGLTEVLTTALVAAFLLVWQGRADNSRKLLLMIALAAMLSVVRPVFVLLFLLLLPMVFPMVRRHGLSFAGLALLMSLPVLLQLGMMEARYD
ncbi:MAG TPA: hypothetical protein P5248_12660, partial [Bacteroidales bacterium]|nr:hypothetical protein [Bacteroidales bacterium]